MDHPIPKGTIIFSTVGRSNFDFHIFSLQLQPTTLGPEHRLIDALILPPNLDTCQRILSQPSIEDISKFPTLEIKSKIKIQKGKLIFVHAPHSETAHTIRKFSQNRSELISENSKFGAHLISSHLRRADLRWSAVSSPTTSEPLIDLALFATPFPITAII
uniref:Uncharacterized protein n=1 Tax=Quercus lobata TaxID=97700 RepID=A0A7N2NA44_QUELO